MPRGSQFGYLFTDDLSSGGFDLGVTCAHELGHGLFQLEHTFSKVYGGVLPQGSTRNLMDYGGGSDFAKWQWDYLYDPGIVLRLFEKDKDAMFFGNPTILEIFNLMRDIRLSKLYHTEIAANFVSASPQGWINMKGSYVFFRQKLSSLMLGAKIKGEGKIIVEAIEKQEFPEASNKYQILINDGRIFWAFPSKTDCDAVYDYLTGGDAVFGKETVMLNGRTYSYKVLYDGIENIRNRFLNEGKYAVMSADDKLILDIPLIQWGLGWHYGGIFYYNWLMGRGDIIADETLHNWLMQWPVLKIRLKEYDQTISEMIGKVIGPKVFNKEFELQNPYTKMMTFPQTNLYILDDLRKTMEVSDTTTGQMHQWNSDMNITNYSTTTVCGIEDSKKLNGWVAAFAGLSLRHCFSGKVIQNNTQNFVLDISEIKLYIRDGFDFIDDNTDTQRLGTWKHDVFNPQLPEINIVSAGLTNKKISLFSKTNGIGRDFSIYLTYDYKKLFKKIVINKTNKTVRYEN